MALLKTCITDLLSLVSSPDATSEDVWNQLVAIFLDDQMTGRMREWTIFWKHTAFHGTSNMDETDVE